MTRSFAILRLLCPPAPRDTAEAQAARFAQLTPKWTEAAK